MPGCLPLPHKSCSNSCPLVSWYHPTIISVASFSSLNLPSIRLFSNGPVLKSTMHTHIAPIFSYPSPLGHHRALLEFPELCRRFSLVLFSFIPFHLCCLQHVRIMIPQSGTEPLLPCGGAPGGLNHWTTREVHTISLKVFSLVSHRDEWKSGIQNTRRSQHAFVRVVDGQAKVWWL